MPQQSVNEDGSAKPTGQDPEGPLRKLTPERQALAIIHIEGRQQDDVGDAHPGDVEPDPAGPAPSRGAAGDGGGNKG